MSAHNDGGPAFPSQETHNNGLPYYLNTGMSLRAYFAAHAPVTLQDARDVCCYREANEGRSDTERAVAMALLALMRVEYADALIAELAKVQP